MKLVHQVAVMIAALLLLLIGVLGLTSFVLLDGEYRILEEHDVLRELYRGEAAMDVERDGLEADARDWAYWDDTYRFSRGEFPEFVERNLMPETFENLDIDSFVIFAPDGSLQSSYTLNRSSLEFETTPPHLLATLTTVGLPARALGADKPIEGLVHVEDQLVMVVAAPILTSTFEGPPAGTLIMARVLDEERMGAVSTLVGVPVSLVLPPLPDGEGSVVLKDGDALLLPENASVINGYSRITDLGGHDVWLRLELPRTVNAGAERAKVVFFGAIVLMVLLFGLIALLATDRLYLRRIRTITTSVETIGRNPGTDRIPALRGTDEISSLGSAINGMLDDLLGFHKRLGESEERFRAVVEDQTELICRIGPDGSVVFANRAFLRLFNLPDGIEGQELVGLLPVSLAGDMSEAIRSTSPEHPTVETEITVENGSTVRQIAFTVRALGGGAHQFVGRDVTEQHEVLAELR